MRIAILLLIVVGGIITASAEETEIIPEWVKTTLVMWTDGEISDQEFVAAIDYLKDKGIVKLSSINDEEIQRQIEYLKAKNEVIRKEVEDLRKANEEYRISLKTQEISKGSTTTSMSELFNEYEALQKEVKILRETNKQFANQINSWMNSDQMANNQVAGNIYDEKKIEQIESYYGKKIDELKQETLDYKNKIEELQNTSLSREKDKQLLEIENENKNDILKSLRSENQANREDIKQLIQGNKLYDKLTTNIQTENLEQKKKLTEYENTLKTLDVDFENTNEKQSKMKEEISLLKQENSKYQDMIKNMGDTSKITSTKELEEANKNISTLTQKIQNYESSILSLEAKNKEYQSKITELEDKNQEKEASIISLNNDHNALNNVVKELNSKITTYENAKVIENKKDQKSIMDAQIQMDVVDKNSIALKAKIIDYENQIKKLQVENKDSKNSLKSITNEMSENYNLIKELNQEKEDYEKRLEVLRKENEILSNQAQLAENQNTNKESSLTGILLENGKLKKQIDLLQTELKQNVQEINSLKNTQLKESSKTYVIQPPELPTLQYDNHQEKLDEVKKQNDRYLVEMNYLKAKSIVIDEEIETLRAENEEYRILINLLKKGEKSQIGIASTSKDNTSSNQGIVVMHKTVDKPQQIPKDWINRIDSTKKYSIYVEPIPKWSADVSGEVNNAIKFWKDTANVNFDVVNTPSTNTAIISWKKTLPNDYDGYTVNQKQVDIALGSDTCDKNWRAYDSKSVRDILIHEIGHILDLGHSIDKSNIMYPMIYNAKFVPIDTTITIDTKDSAFIKTCSFSADPVYKYVVKTQDTTKKFDLFFVSSDSAKQRFDTGKVFDYYSDINCIGLSKSVQSGICKNVVDTGGLLIINSENKEKITVTVHVEEK